MKILVLENSPHAADAVAARLQAAGHETVRCHQADEAAFPCRGITEEGCPLAAGDVAAGVVVRRRPHPRVQVREDGVNCILAHRLPLVVGGPVILSPFDQYCAAHVEDEEQIVGVIEAVTKGRARHHETVVATSLPDDVWATVERDGPDLVVTIGGGRDEAELTRQGVRALQVLRAYDPFARQVSVRLAR